MHAIWICLAVNLFVRFAESVHFAVKEFQIPGNHVSVNIIESCLLLQNYHISFKCNMYVQCANLISLKFWKYFIFPINKKGSRAISPKGYVSKKKMILWASEMHF